MLEGVDFVAEVMQAGGDENRRKEEASEQLNRRRMFEECNTVEDGEAAPMTIKFPVKTR